jgi:cytochrome c556
MRKSIATFAAVCTLAVSASSVAQQPPTPEQQAQQAVAVRQSIFKLLGWQIAPVGGMLQNRVPFDAAVVERHASRIAALGTMIPEAFAADTRGRQVRTEARDGIWTNRGDFESKAQNLVGAANALAKAAAGGDRAATLRAAGEMAGMCKACHDTYRAN